MQDLHLSFPSVKPSSVLHPHNKVQISSTPHLIPSTFLVFPPLSPLDPYNKLRITGISIPSGIVLGVRLSRDDHRNCLDHRSQRISEQSMRNGVISGRPRWDGWTRSNPTSKGREGPLRRINSTPSFKLVHIPLSTRINLSNPCTRIADTIRVDRMH